MLKRRLWLSLLLLLAVLIMAGCGSSGSVKNGKVIGSVNGDEITQSEFDNAYKIRELYYEKQVAQINNANQGQQGMEIAGVKDPTVIKSLQKAAWDDVVMQKLILQQAPEEGIEVSDKELGDVVKSDEFKNFVKTNKMDENAYIESVKTQYLYNKLYKKITGQAEVSDKEIEEYYKAHLSEFQEAGGIETYHILVKTEKEANDIMAQIKGGADFADLAKKYSKDTGSAIDGGFVGLTNQDSQWVPEFKQAALALKPGEITKTPVKSQFGYHIIKAGSIKNNNVRTLKDARNQIMMSLQKQKEEKVANQYLDNLKKKAVIKDYRTKSTNKTSTSGKASKNK
ncbi:MAG: peptidyl-prolyl cis-trans isomerase [Deltaproteobacteria bacterium]